jgi:hypothetical protein
LIEEEEAYSPERIANSPSSLDLKQQGSDDPYDQKPKKRN